MSRDQESTPAETESAPDPAQTSAPSQELTPEEQEQLQQLLERSGRDPQESQILLQRMTVSGPLPPPQILEQYGEILPDAPQRIVTMAEKEQEHRHHVESNALQGQIALDRRGQRFGLTIGVSALAVALILGLNDQELAASIIGGIDLVALVGVFVYGRVSQGKASSEKEDS